MSETRRFGLAELLLLLIVLAVAAGARACYLCACADNANSDGPLQVQDARPPLALPPQTELRGRPSPTELDALVHNLKEYNWFGSLAPFAAVEERTAHTSPGYPWLLALLARAPLDLGPTDRTARWIQCGLGSLTAGLYFLFALAAFRSRLVALLAGLLGALHPFWIINTAEIDDGVLATFLLAVVLFLGAHAGQSGGALTSLLYGLALAGLALVRAALLPFAFVAVIWFLLRCRSLRGGWLYALVGFLGFLIGVAPWTLRNWQAFGDLIPIADSTYLHLWIGNNPKATGGPMNPQALREALAESRKEEPSVAEAELARIGNQRRRYAQLGYDVGQEIRDHPAETLRRRLWALLDFFFGEKWFKDGTLAQRESGRELPAWLDNLYPTYFSATLLGMLLLGALGWRWTYAWRREAALAALALVWCVLPYVLSHAEELSGPRLPLDGVLLTYAAFALAGLLPGVGARLRAGPPEGRPAEGPV
jgi:hypothetical protein